MKNKNAKGHVALLLGALMGFTVLTGCGSGESETGADANTPKASETADSSDNEQTKEKKVIKVGIGNGYNPFCYLDDDENPAGYDYDTFQLLIPYLEDKYEFAFTPDEFQNLLIGLDTKAYDIAVHHYGWTQERAENYLYADEGTMYFGNFVLGSYTDVDDITDDIESIAGHVIVVNKGSMSEQLLTAYNDEHPDAQVTIELTDNNSAWEAGFKSGLYDATVLSAYDLAVYNEQHGDILNRSSFTFTSDDYNCGTYFIYSKGDDELKEDIDAAIVKIKEDGSLAELSRKWLGDDYTINPNE